MENRLCSQCTFWAINPQDLKQGACNRYPPTAALVPMQTPLGGVELQNASVWPVTRGNEGCGEFKKKEHLTVV
jgi:hypothetical protein